MHERRELYRKMGERLREYRTDMHYTQETTAELLEMSLTYYGRIERGLNGLSLEKNDFGIPLFKCGSTVSSHRREKTDNDTGWTAQRMSQG